MYKCFHCGDLHFLSDQARRCAESGLEWVPDAVREARRQRERGRVPWQYKMEARRRSSRTGSERELWRALNERLPGKVFFAEWWLDECDYRVDFLVTHRLVIEVDGDSHRGREGEDRYRSAEIRAYGYEVARATAEHVLADADGIATQILFRARSVAAGDAPGSVEPPTSAVA
jgi:very-short-patch-repair endonuclease